MQCMLPALGMEPPGEVVSSCREVWVSKVEGSEEGDRSASPFLHRPELHVSKVPKDDRGGRVGCLVFLRRLVLKSQDEMLDEETVAAVEEEVRRQGRGQAAECIQRA